MLSGKAAKCFAVLFTVRKDLSAFPVPLPLFFQNKFHPAGIHISGSKKYSCSNAVLNRLDIAQVSAVDSPAHGPEISQPWKRDALILRLRSVLHVFYIAGNNLLYLANGIEKLYNNTNIFLGVRYG